LIIETKYNFGDVVYTIEKITSTKWEECSVCCGKGEIELSHKKYSCPECGKRYRSVGGNHIYTGHRWKVHYLPKTIGRISAEVYAPNSQYRSRNKDDITYMCEETGVGSGTVWYQCDLYETLEKAQEKCMNLNLIIENKREEIKHKILNGRTLEQYGSWSALEKEVNEEIESFRELEELVQPL
jgi:hypothetical protein